MKELKTPRFNFVQHMMLRALIGYCTSDENQPITDLINGFAGDIDAVREKTNSITSILGEGKQNITGNALTKQDFKELLTDAMMQVCGPVKSYASSIVNNQLLMAVNHSRSGLLKMKAQLLVSAADDLVKVVTPYIGSLTKYHVDQASLTTVATASDKFNDAMSTPRLSIVNRSGKLKEIGIIQHDAMEITRNQLDPLAIKFEGLGQVNYLNGYIKARKLTPFGNLHTRASVSVIMGDSDAPIANATVHIENALLTGSTDSKGHVTISRVPIGMQNLIVTAPGFPQPVNAGPFKFIKGKATPITINITAFHIPDATPVVAKQMA